MQLVEYIGNDGIKVTNLEMCPSRLSEPRPGDTVDVGNFIPTYPFLRERYTVIDSIKDNRIILCCEGASCFIYWSEKEKQALLSISGGPFQGINKTDIVPTGELRARRFWNWGPNSPGGGMGVGYHIERPVFKLIKFNDKAPLETLRREAADKAFEQYNFGDCGVSKSGQWTIDGVYWSRLVYFDNDEGSAARVSFGVEFKPETNEIIDSWVQK